MKLWQTKLVLGTALYVVGLGLYGVIQRWPWREPLIIPWNAVDLAIPVTPQAIWIYGSLYPLIFLPWWACGERAQLLRFARRLALVMAIGLLLLALLPTTVVRPPLAPGADVSTSVVMALRNVDGPGNTAPSMHAALALMLVSGSWTILPRLRGWSVCWLVALLWSCVAIRQHTLVDLLLGLLLAGGIILADRHRDGPTEG